MRFFWPGGPYTRKHQFVCNKTRINSSPTSPDARDASVRLSQCNLSCTGRQIIPVNSCDIFVLLFAGVSIRILLSICEFCNTVQSLRRAPGGDKFLLGTGRGKEFD